MASVWREIHVRLDEAAALKVSLCTPILGTNIYLDVRRMYSIEGEMRHGSGVRVRVNNRELDDIIQKLEAVLKGGRGNRPTEAGGLVFRRIGELLLIRVRIGNRRIRITANEARFLLHTLKELSQLLAPLLDSDLEELDMENDTENEIAWI